MLRGAEISRNYSADLSGALVLDAEHHLKPGAVTAVSPRIGDIHEVANALTDRTSISIHAYGANIGAVVPPPLHCRNGRSACLCLGLCQPAVAQSMGSRGRDAAPNWPWLNLAHHAARSKLSFKLQHGFGASAAAAIISTKGL